MNKMEQALKKRYLLAKERLQVGTKQLPKLEMGDAVCIQNQRWNTLLKLDRNGAVIETKDFDKYLVTVDGISQAIWRNRKFLRKITFFQTIQPGRIAQQDHHHPREWRQV